MAGTLVANTINTDTGLFSTNNAYSGIAKAWVNFNASSGSVVINNSFNVSSITYNGTGNFTLNFATAMPNANYAFVGTCCSSTGTTNIPAGIVTLSYGTAPTTSAVVFFTGDSRNGNFQNNQYTNVAVLGT